MFTETGHGKRPMHGVDNISFNPDATIRNTGHLLKYLPKSENITIGKYSNTDVQFYTSMFPNTFSIKYKNFGLSKVQEIYLSLLDNKKIQWEKTIAGWQF